MRLSRSTASGAAADVGAAQAVVAREQGGAADVTAVAVRFDGQLADGGGVAQAQIEPLRADRRDHVGGFADERDATVAEAPRGGDGERKQAASGRDRDLAEDGMGRAFDLGG